MNKFEIDSSYLFFSKAEKLSLKLKEKPFMVSILLNKSNLLWLKKNYSEAEVTAFEALDIAQNKQYYDYEYTCYIIIANTLLERNKYEKAIEYYKKALVIALNQGQNFDQSALPLSYSYIAKVYQKQNNHQQAIEFANKGLAYKNLRSDNIKVYCYLKNVLGKAIYKSQKKEALSIYIETLKIGDSLNFGPIQVASQLQLGEYYLYYKDTLNANTYLQKAKELAHQNKLFDDELIILKLLVKSNPLQGNYYSDRYIHLNDSLQNVERATRDKFARIEFETDEISNQRNQIQIEYKKLNTQLFLVIGFTLLTFLSLYFWFKNKANKAKIKELKLIQEKQELQNNELLLIQEQQSNDEKIYQLLLSQQEKIEEAKQIEKKRISRELHDGIMGKLSGIRLNLYILKKKTDPETIAKCLEFVKEMQVIENDLRLLSHDLNKETISTANGIESEIVNIFHEINNHQSIKFDLQIDKGIIWENINYMLKLNLYRIIQEALHNIDKYAQAKKVQISISQKKDALLISIKDDGIGFDSKIQKKGIGLKNMRERTEELGGEFIVETALEEGTIINLVLPC
ncbi:ATP-binding protein [Flavobacterium antarcticum]|uniref:tetratricopeptide repeat-containing sensor histidine kinase n=1 Tax=Flavobacterium antarcticum TaxID=271155 RepID=UPI00146CA0F0|nr:ATP-binding protein [Flavobacterium antarcticum]